MRIGKQTQNAIYDAVYNVVHIAHQHCCWRNALIPQSCPPQHTNYISIYLVLTRISTIYFRAGVGMSRSQLHANLKSRQVPFVTKNNATYIYIYIQIYIIPKCENVYVCLCILVFISPQHLWRHGSNASPLFYFGLSIITIRPQKKKRKKKISPNHTIYIALPLFLH